MSFKNIAIVIPCWMRPEILSLTIKQLNVLCEKTSDKVNITVIYSLSHEDPQIKEVIALLKLCKHKYIVVFSNNNLLGQKVNDAITIAISLDYDYIMNLGSDDLVHPNLIDLYLPFLEMEIPVFGLTSVWFYKSGQTPFNFCDYNGDYLIGAGRMIHKKVIEKVIEKFGALYQPGINRGMDTHSAKRIIECGYNQIIVYDGNEPLIVDIKSDVNIHNYDAIRSAKFSKTNSDINILEYFPILKNNEQN